MKQLSIILLAFVTCWLAGCTVEETNNDNPVNKDGNAHLKVTFSNGTQSRAIGDPFAAELAEKTINKLSFYVYPAKEADKEMVPFQRYVFDMTTMPLTNDSVSIAYANNTDAGGGYTCDFILREGAGFECTIVAIANAPDNFDRTNNLDTYAKLQQAYIDCETMPNTPAGDLTTSNRTDKYGLAMYAEDTKMIKKALTTNVVFDMERLAARIDISNAAYEEAEANGFVLQSARIINGKHTSYVIPALTTPWTHPGLTTNFEAITSDANPNAFRLATKTGTVSGGNTTDADPSMEDGKIEQRLWHALYTYENDDEKDATATSIEIKGLFRGAPFSRILPFVNYDKNPVIIQRNHRYLVRLNPAASLTDITYNITVAEWNAVDTINVKPTQKEVPTLIYKPEHTPVNKTLEILNKNASFTLDAVCQFDTQAKVVPEVGDDPGTDVSWVKVTATEPEVVTRTTGYKRTYTVTATDITDDQPRQAMLLIANGANFTARDTLHIKQVMAQGKPIITYTNDHKPDANKILEVYNKNAVFTLDAVCQFDTQYKVVPEVGAPTGTDVSWVTVIPGEPEVVTRTTGYKRTYTVKATDLPSDQPRHAMLLIANGFNFTVRDTLHIKQVMAEQIPVITYESKVLAPRSTVYPRSNRLANLSITLDATCPVDTRCEVYSGSGVVSIKQGDPDGTADKKRTYTITLDRFYNGDVERYIYLRIYNDCNPKVYETVTIRHQFIYPNTDNYAPRYYKGQYWAPVNEGATRIPFSVTSYDQETCGLLYQWGKKQGQKYGGGPYDVSKDDDWWYSQGWNYSMFLKGRSDHQGSWFKDNKSYSAWPRYAQPCPDGWRLPTDGELRQIYNQNPRLSNGIYKVSTYNGYDFILPAVGWRNLDGSSTNIGITGSYWSSRLNSSGMTNVLNIYTNSTNMNENSLGYGCSVRCIQE